VTVSTFILKNALRNKRRALLSVSSVAVSLFLLVTLQVALRELTLPVESAGAELRVCARNKVSLTNPLPARQREIIEKIPGVEGVTPFTWFGGQYQNEGAMTFAQFAMDAKETRRVFTDVKLTETELAEFESEKTAAIIGKISADKHKFKVGDHITLNSSVYPGALEFKIAGIFSGTADDRMMFFHQEYLDESIGTPGLVGMWWLKVKTAEDMPRVIKAINETFQNTAAEVRAESERNFQLGFISMLGNIKTLIASISTVVVFTLVLVTASTMSMAVRERFRELAILKALGFRRRELFAFILAESFSLAVIGAVLGIGGAYCLYTFGNIGKMTAGIFVSFEVTPRIMGFAALVAALLGIISAVAPSLSVARMSVVNGLKTLD
jgi:putative ABC transport system permease protein